MGIRGSFSFSSVSSRDVSTHPSWISAAEAATPLRALTRAHSTCRHTIKATPHNNKPGWISYSENSFNHSSKLSKNTRHERNMLGRVARRAMSARIMLVAEVGADGAVASATRAAVTAARAIDGAEVTALVTASPAAADAAAAAVGAIEGVDKVRCVCWVVRRSARLQMGGRRDDALRGGSQGAE